MIVLSGQDHGPTRSANAVGDEGAIKPHSLFRQPINVGRFVPIAAVRTDRLIGVVIGHDEQNVGAGVGSGADRCGGEETADEKQK
jgi:hypothetical protein